MATQLELPTPAWLTIREVSRELRLSMRTIERLIAPKAGKHRLLSAKIGSSIRIRRSVLDQWLSDREAVRNGGTR